MTFQDIFQSSFLSRVSSVSPLDMGLALGLAFLLGLFIFLIYKKSYSGVMYSPSFGVTLIALALITTLLILAVSSNVVLSLGMVGALSIVRFRTAIKEPMDIAFLFWSIAVGIVLAAGLILGMGFGNFQSAGQAVSLSLVSKSRFAQATTTFFIFFDLGIGLGPYLFGFMIPAAGYDGMYQTLAFVVLGAVLLYYVLHGRRVAAA